MVLLLEGEDVSQDVPNTAGRTLLSFAVVSNCEEVARPLLGHRGVSSGIEKVNQIAWTPLVRVASCGPEWMKKRLLERRATGRDDHLAVAPAYLQL